MKLFNPLCSASCVAIVFSAFLAWQNIPPTAVVEFAQSQWEGVHTTGKTEINIKSRIVSDTTGAFVHSASVTELPSGELLTTWFSGSREGARDVDIVAAKYNPETGIWGKNFTLFTTKNSQDQLNRYIKKVGNPVLTTLDSGRVWIFYVTVSLGGWAGSAINAAYSDDGGTTWSKLKRLITSPFFNLSTLVKTKPLLYADGSLGLPVYHEFIGKFAELLRISADGVVLEKNRIHYGRESLQPMILTKNKYSATALMRYTGGSPKRVLINHSADGGRNWSPAKKTSLPNPNSALAALRLRDNSLIAVLNDLEVDRYRLSLYRSNDEGVSWQKLFVFEDGAKWGSPIMSREAFIKPLSEEFFSSAGAERRALGHIYLKNLDKRVCKRDRCEFRFDYPYLLQSSSGDFHLLYTWNKSFIKHVQFNSAWLESLSVEKI